MAQTPFGLRFVLTQPKVCNVRTPLYSSRIFKRSSLLGGEKLERAASRTINVGMQRVKVDFHCRVIFTYVKVEPRSTFTFTWGFSYITSILIYARKAS